MYRQYPFNEQKQLKAKVKQIQSVVRFSSSLFHCQSMTSPRAGSISHGLPVTHHNFQCGKTHFQCGMNEWWTDLSTVLLSRTLTHFLSLLLVLGQSLPPASVVQKLTATALGGVWGSSKPCWNKGLIKAGQASGIHSCINAHPTPPPTPACGIPAVYLLPSLLLPGTPR